MSGISESVVSELANISANSQHTFGSLSGEQLNWKPSEESWSIAQCFGHLIKTNDEMLPSLRSIADGTYTNSFWQNYSPFTGLIGNYLVNTMKNDLKKIKAPSKKIVPPSDIPADIILRFRQNNELISETIKSCAAADPEKTILTSPFMGLMTYKLADAITIIIEHEKRHFRQAERVKQTEGFPNG